MFDVLKVYKRAITLLLSLIMLLSTITLLSSGTVVFADETTKFKTAENLLVGLNIIDKDEPDVLVTRGKFADVFVKAINIYNADFVPTNPFNDTQNSEYYEAIEILHSQNYLMGVGNNNYEPEKAINIEDIARLYVCASGNKMYPEINSVTFMTAANRLGILKGVSYTEEITMHNLIIMTYNLLVEAPIGKYDFSKRNSYRVDSRDDLLYQIFDVVKETGMVSENSASGLWSKSSVNDGYVKIQLKDGTVTALTGNTDISNYLGYTLDVYIEYGDSENRVVCYEERADTDVCTIDISDIIFEDSTMSRIVYAPEERRTKTENIASFPSVIFNGVYYDEGAFDLNTLKNHEGTVTLIKSQNSNEYDIINVVAYTDYFVSNVEYYNGEMHVYDEGVNSKLVLDEQEGEIKIYYPNGAEASIYELQAKMLLTVIKSADLKKMTIYICDYTETNDIIGVDTKDRRVVITGNKEYKVSASYPIEDIETGKNAKMYFDHLGNIGWIEKDKDYTDSFAIVRSAYSNTDKTTESGEEKVILKAFVKQGEFTNFTLAQRVKIDGISRKNTEEQLAALEEINVAGFQAGSFPMRYVLNDAGEIINIDTPKFNNGPESKDSLRTCLEKNATTAGVLFSSDGILAKKLLVSSSTKVFVLPEDVNLLSNINMYGSGGKSMLSTGKNTNVMAFQTKDDSMNADLVVIWKEQSDYAKLDHDNKLFLIDDIKDVYDPDSHETVKEVKGIEGGVEKTYRTYSEFDTSKIENLSKGDVVRFAYYNGAIFNVEVVFKKDPQFPKDPQTGETGDTFGTYNRPKGSNDEKNNEGNYDMYFCGYVRSREGKFLKIWTAGITQSGSNVSLPKTITWTNDDMSSEEYRVVQATNIAVYDSTLGTNGKTYVGDIENIPYFDGSGQYAIVIMRYRSRSPQEIIVIK